MKKRLGDLLCQVGLITEADLDKALQDQKNTGRRLGETLIDLKLATEFDITKTLASQLNIPYIAMEVTPVEPEAVSLLPETLARKYICIPIHLDKKYLAVAMVDPLDYEAIKDMSFHSTKEIRPYISTRKEILEAIEQYYRLDDSVEHIMNETVGEFKDSGLEISPARSSSEIIPTDYLEKKSQMAPIVRMVNFIVLRAIKARASDIHVEPLKTGLSIRFRVDGILREEMILPKWVQGALVSRIKILSSLDIAERRLPQDGAIRVQLDNGDYDLRISTIPTHYGEKVVIRILNQDNAAIALEALGLSEGNLKQVANLSQKRKGILLVSGPTGSGKTTTLYALIKRLRSGRINIMTVEDPIEYHIEGVNQIQIQPEIGLTFANSLRSILRQDPNIILVGEIRDLETAEIAFRAAMTGHLVISTLHTNDAVSSITRLIDMGIPRYMIASSVIGIIAQRLVRKICPKCKTEAPIPVEGVRKGSFRGDVLEGMDHYRGEGCSYCSHTGYYGRIGIYEVFPFTTRIKECIASDGTEEEVRMIAQGFNMATMGDDGILKVKEGETTIEEVLRVIELEEDVRTLCPQCEKPLHLDFVICPYCRYELQRNCNSCSKPLQSDWILCPYCKKEV
jgi:type IV pilus assembly protein PilB